MESDFAPESGAEDIPESGAEETTEAAESAAAPVAESAEPAAESGGPRTDRVDRALQVVAGVLAAALIALAGYAGYTVWRVSQEAKYATPALRLIETLKDDVRNDPNSPELRVRLGEALGAAGLYREAIEQLEIAIELSPNHSGAYLDLGIISMELEEYDAAESYFTKVLELTEGTDFTDISDRRELALFYLGEIALIQERYEDAIGYFKGALRIRRDAADTYFDLGLAFKGLGEYDAAIEQFETALLFDNEYAEAHYELGQIYLEQGDYVNAALRFSDAARLAPDVEVVQEALMSVGQFEDWMSKAQDAYDDGAYEDALEAVLVARALDLESIDAIVLHGRILEAQEKFEDAESVYREGLGKDPENEELQAALERVKDK